MLSADILGFEVDEVRFQRFLSISYRMLVLSWRWAWIVLGAKDSTR